MNEFKTLLKLLADRIKHYHALKIVDNLHLFQQQNNDASIQRKIIKQINQASNSTLHAKLFSSHSTDLISLAFFVFKLGDGAIVQCLLNQAPDLISSKMATGFLFQMPNTEEQIFDIAQSLIKSGFDINSIADNNRSFLQLLQSRAINHQPYNIHDQEKELNLAFFKVYKLFIDYGAMIQDDKGFLITSLVCDNYHQKILQASLKIKNLDDNYFNQAKIIIEKNYSGLPEQVYLSRLDNMRAQFEQQQLQKVIAGEEKNSFKNKQKI